MSEGPSTWVAVFTVVERGLDVAKIPKSNLAKHLEKEKNQ
jgi:hypothetical protein